MPMKGTQPRVATSFTAKLKVKPQMKLFDIFKSFKNDDSGAVTVDWVVLTAAVVGLGIIVITQIRPAISAAGARITLDVQQAAVRPAP